MLKNNRKNNKEYKSKKKKTIVPQQVIGYVKTKLIMSKVSY